MRTEETVLRYLVTGGCGFIGGALVRQLYNQGVGAIRVLDNLSVGARERLTEIATPDGDIELVVGDVTDADVVRRAAADIDVIVHLAASTGIPPSLKDPRHDFKVNAEGTLNCLLAGVEQGVKRFVFASSGAAVGQCAPPIHEELPAHPISPYGASKLTGEAYCSAVYHSFELETVILRFANVYGPGSAHKSSVVAKFLRQALDGEPLEIYGDGAQTRDFVYIDDLVRAVQLAATVPGVGGEAFQIAAASETSIGELTDLLQAALADAGQPRPQVRYTQPRKGDVTRNYADTSKAKSMLGWTPEVPLAQGVRQTLDWFLEQNA